MDALPSVLVVEDQAISARAAKVMLERIGCRVIGVMDTGEGAISAAERSRPDLVLMDIRLKGKMHGVEAAALIQERFGTPIIYVSAYSPHELSERHEFDEASRCLSKPIGEAELAAAVRDVLAGR